MGKRLWVAIGLALAIAGCSTPKTASSVLQGAQDRMGHVSSIQYSGTGVNGFFGQALTAGQEWPRRELSSYARTINYDQRSASDKMGFAQPVFGGQQQNAHVNGDKAWNIGQSGPNPRLAAAEERQLHIWLTPHGFLKEAIAADDATLSQEEGGADVISFTALGKFRVSGTIDVQNLVTSVATTIANPVLGDTDLVATYSDYKDFSGVQFPTKILIVQGGFPVWDLTITNVTPNAPFDLPVPEAVQAATIPPVRAVSTKVADGVWQRDRRFPSQRRRGIRRVPRDCGSAVERRALAGGVGGGQEAGAEQAGAVRADHPSSLDHSGGLRTYVAEGATVVTHQSNVPYFERTLTAPATLVPDMQAKSPKAAQLPGRVGQVRHYRRQADDRGLRDLRRHPHQRVHAHLSSSAEDPSGS